MYSPEISVKTPVISSLLRLAATVLLFLFLSNTAYAQVGIGTNKPDSSAALDIQDTARGLLIPRMKSAQKNAVNKPAEGLMVYQTDSVKGFWYYSAGLWKPVVSPNNGGRQTLLLTDDITDAEAKEKIEAEAGPNTQIIRIIGCTKLHNVDLSSVTGVLEVFIYDNPILDNINLSSLRNVNGSFLITSCPKLKSINLSSLEKLVQTSQTVDVFSVSGTGLENMDFPSLQKVSGSLNIIGNETLQSISFSKLRDQFFRSNISVTVNNNLTSISFAALDSVKQLGITYNQKLTSISMPSLTKTSQLDFNNNGKLATLSLPALTTIASLFISNDTLLTTVSMPALKSVTTIFSLFSNNSLVSVSLPVMTNATSLNFTSNSSLASVSLPAITNAPEINFISNNALSSASFGVLASAEKIYFRGNNSLTSLLLPSLVKIAELYLQSNPVMISVSFPALKTAGNITIDNYFGNDRPALQLSSCSLPVLTQIDRLSITGTDINALSFPVLTQAIYLYLNGLNSLTTVSLPSLPAIGALELQSNIALTSVSLPLMTDIARITIEYCDALTSLSFPALKKLTNPLSESRIDYCKNLVSVSIDNLTQFNNIGFRLWGNKLPSVQINYLLNKFVSITPPLASKYFYLTQSVPAPPTGQGITDKATLVANSNNVQTD